MSRGASAIRQSLPAQGALAILVLLAIIALVAPLVSPESFSGYVYTRGGTHPQFGWRYLLGADVSGHSILSYVILGARATLGVATLATVVALAAGGILAAVTRRLPSVVGGAILFLADGMIAILFLPFLLVLGAFVAGGDAWSLGFLFGLVGIPAVIVSSVRAGVPPTDSAQSPRPADRGSANLLHRVPRTKAGAWVRLSTLVLCGFIAASTTVDFLGFGLPASNPSWGNALSLVQDYFDAGYWWWVLFPGLAIAVTLAAVNVLGGALYDAVEIVPEPDNPGSP
ncbi:MAG TPA: hypothetical protein VG815_18620 [Chloroflexota bacterium]|nr:hypothetical protein [Chloroflexota bacterium]